MLARSLLVVGLLTSPAFARHSNEAGLKCLPTDAEEVLLRFQYHRVRLAKSGHETRVYIAEQAGHAYRIEMDACTTQVLSTTHLS